MTMNSSLYDIRINTLLGEPLNLEAFRGKKLLIVNVASTCGFTKQYKSRQQLYDNYKDNLVVIGVPCNQFGKQEPGTASEINQFCEINYGVTFPITEKISVKGKEQHMLYQWLTDKKINKRKNSSVKWNFQKYLIDEQGQLIDYYFSITHPMSNKITKHL